MAERIVVNTGPLLAVARGQAAAIVGRLPYDFVAPMEVRLELDDGVVAGHPAVDTSWVRFVALQPPLTALARSTLDDGEAAVIQLALDHGIPLVCIDERKGRRAALAVGLRVVGTLGLLGRAKALGLVPSVRPFIAAMLASGIWFDAKLVTRFCKAIGE